MNKGYNENQGHWPQQYNNVQWQPPSTVNKSYQKDQGQWPNTSNQLQWHSQSTVNKGYQKDNWPQSNFVQWQPPSDQAEWVNIEHQTTTYEYNYDENSYNYNNPEYNYDNTDYNYNNNEQQMEVSTGTTGYKSNGQNNNDLSCVLCKITLHSPQVAEAHYSGKKHKKMMEHQQWGYEIQPNQGTIGINIKCDICQLTLLGPAQADAHYKGKKHQANAAKNAGYSLEVHCAVCNVTMPSDTVARAHYAGKKHRENVEGRGTASQQKAYNSFEGNKYRENAYGKGTGAQLKAYNSYEGTNQNQYAPKKRAFGNNSAMGMPPQKGILKPAQSQRDHFVGKKPKLNMKQQETKYKIFSVNMNNMAVAKTNYASQKNPALEYNVGKKNPAFDYNMGKKNPSFGKKTPAKVRCDICCLTLLSQDQATAHFGGKKHKFQLSRKVLGESGNNRASNNTPTQNEGNMPKINAPEKEVRQPNNVAETIQCQICKIPLKSKLMATEHFAGKKHKNNLAKIECGDKPTYEEAHCDVCNITFQKFQAPAHFEGNKHKTNLLKKNGIAIQPKVDQSLIKKNVFICKNMKDIEYQIAHATAMDEATWLQAHDITCGLCLLKLESKNAAVEHFNHTNHLKREKLQVEGDTSKWCPACFVELNSPYTAYLHYNGRQHKAKVEMAKKLGTVDLQVLSNLESAAAIKAAMKPIKAAGLKRSRETTNDSDEPAVKK